MLSRTVRGMMRYGDGLRVLARLEGVPEEDIEMARDIAQPMNYSMATQSRLAMATHACYG